MKCEILGNPTNHHIAIETQKRRIPTDKNVRSDFLITINTIIPMTIPKGP
jgi:hypothetical protein